MTTTRTKASPIPVPRRLRAARPRRAHARPASAVPRGNAQAREVKGAMTVALWPACSRAARNMTGHARSGRKTTRSDGLRFPGADPGLSARCRVLDDAFIDPPGEDAEGGQVLQGLCSPQLGPCSWAARLRSPAKHPSANGRSAITGPGPAPVGLLWVSRLTSGRVSQRRTIRGFAADRSCPAMCVRLVRCRRQRSPALGDDNAPSPARCSYCR
jgi:hypothetical protein